MGIGGVMLFIAVISAEKLLRQRMLYLSMRGFKHMLELYRSSGRILLGKNRSALGC